MRLSILALLLFSMLSGVCISTTHESLGSFSFYQAGNQHLIASSLTNELNQQNTFYFETALEYISVDEMEDDENRESLSLRKRKIFSKYLLASFNTIRLSRTHNNRNIPTPESITTSYIYITLRTLRI